MSEKPRLQALTADGDMAFWLKDQPKCPHCGADINIPENDLWRLYEEGVHDLDCPFCDQEFRVKSSVTFMFSTDEQESDK